MRIQTKITIAAAAIALACAGAFGFTVIKYFSPNNDGVRDVLEFPFSAADNGRIIAWKMVIKNSRGQVVRTIGNKVALPAKITAKEVLKQLAKSKEGVIIPEKVVWDGTMDDGTMAPDGEYFYYVSVKDEEGNESNSKTYNVYLDNTKPEAKVAVNGYDGLIFGEGNKSILKIEQSGTVEKKWEGKITDSEGVVVRNYNWNGKAPENFTWDGTDDKGMIVPDGVYNYSLIGEDKAENVSDEVSIKNIIFSAEKPATNITISGSKYFSIPGKSDNTKIVFDVVIPEPSNGGANWLVDWAVSVCAKNGVVVWNYDARSNGKIKPPAKIEFNGKNNTNAYVADGEYYATVKAKYRNGYETVPVNTSIFVFDTTAPTAAVTAEDKIFSPDGDGRKDFMRFKLVTEKNGGSPIKGWYGKIVNADSDAVVKNYDFGTAVPASVTWNGLDDAGKIASDGNYEFILTGSDYAGNSVTAKTSEYFALDTSKTEIMLAASDLIISPNGDSVKDSIIFTPVVKVKSNPAKCIFEIKDAKGNAVYSKTEASKIPEKIIWDGKGNGGKILSDGNYSANLTIESVNGSVAKVEVPGIILDTVAPSVQLAYDYKLFSPDGDGNKDEFVLNTKNCTSEDLWTVKVTDKNGRIVKTFSFNGTIDSSIKWDGTDEAGNKVNDGVYSLSVSSVDKAGNKFAKAIDQVTVDARAVKVYITSAYEGFSPKSETGLTTQKFNLRTSLNEGIKSWSLDVLNEKGASVYKTSMNSENKILPKEIVWNGTGSDGKVCEGQFYGLLTMEYEKGNKVSEKTASFLCSNKAPELTVRTSPEFFSPDNDGTDDDLFIKLGAKCSGKLVSWSFVILNPEESGRKGKAFWKTSGTTKISEQLTWNGLSNVSKEKNGQAERVQSAMDYPWEFTVTDSLGLTTVERGVISIDILVTRDGSVLKMAVPAIIFRSNHADFKTNKEVKDSKVTPEQAANNERVLKRVSEVLKKFPDYTITVVGHANNITGTEAEETSTENGNIPLIPLSQERADFVKTKLEGYGIEARRMSTQGKGGRERIAALNDRENWWKNRRVEFLLHK